MILRDELGDFDVAIDGPGWEYFWRSYESGEWEDYNLNRLRQIEWGSRLFVDVGAWVGPVTLWAARLGATRILAIEPDPVAYAALVGNVARNGLRGVTTLCAAVTAETGLVRIGPNDGGELGNSSTRVSESGLLTAGFALPDLLDLLGVQPEEVALAKVDVEGYESELMPVLQPWLDAHGVPFVVEPHPLETVRATTVMTR